MSIVFINDHPFFVDKNNNVFTSGTLDSSIWSRFTDNFGDLTVIGRGISLDDNNHKHKSSSCQQVSFDLFMQIKGGIDYYKYRREIREKLTLYIQNSKYIVIRLPSSIGVMAAEICVTLGKKYFVEVVGCAFDSLWYYGGALSKLLAPINANKNKKAIKSANAVVYVTKEYLQRKYPNQNDQINASNVIIEDFPISVLQNHINFLKRSTTKKIFGMIGNVEIPYKGYEYLFKALSTIPDPFELHIVGGGKQDWINTLIVKYKLLGKVILRGRINNKDDMYNFLDGLDIYFQPSLTEGLPRGVIEAMSRGCPVIATNVGGIPELIQSNKTYNSKDYMKLGNLISDNINNINELISMSVINFNKSKEYSFEKINARRNTFFNKIKDKIKN
ncbi:glycosyltransferase [Sphingobacterium sp. WM]|uniref:glycosyltransferase n=1 Tax=Sphingobacterium sp. WM TaxID=3031802 RepID=UPI00240DF2BB|nr:glycosyltransferase [Sphingobacterium sp. WM]WFB63282.1 glycosyltransferase [Sphingobacterium sp. WM]